MHEVKAKSILSPSNGMNVFRGCSHGCIYCDTRSTCYDFNHDFEDIEVKINAPELLEKALLSKRKQCMIGTGSMCDPYIPIEKSLGITRKCLELIERYGYGATVLTKFSMVLRDIELLDKINRKTKAVVQMTLTTFDEDLCRIIEPHVSTTRERFEVLMRCKQLNIPTVVWLSPVLPFINDSMENLDGVLDYCIKASVKGIICFGFGLTLREGNREYFYQKLDEHFPGLKEKYINTYKDSYECSSPNSYRLYKHFVEVCKAHNIMYTPEDCFAYLREFPVISEQTSLF